MQTPSQKMGILAEQLAQKYLKDKGYEILALNYKKPWGEIDIVAQKGDCIYFVEVKANSKKKELGFNPELRVDRKKFFHIVRTAESFLKDKSLDLEWQVDIIAVVFELESQKASIKHFKKVNTYNF